jgi:hypothetical protein
MKNKKMQFFLFFNKDIFRFILFLFISFVYFVLCLGWVFNIFKIIQAETITGFVIARCIGVFMAPLGGILGWF